MGFKFCDSMIASYRTLGYVIFRGIVPPSLIRDLRRAGEKCYAITRDKAGPQSQRLQPLKGNLDDADLKPFEDFTNLPDLVDAVYKILTPRHDFSPSVLSTSGVLLEPAEKPWCTDWHRDIRETHDVPDVEEFRLKTGDPLFFNQINAPLYEDNCTWYVPGSYHRDFDLPGEASAASASPRFTDADGYEERERRCLEYTRNMPGSIRVSMDAGDFALYHPNGWHTGNYLPDRKRVTIHSFAPTPELRDWYRRWNETKQKKRAQQQEKQPA